MTDFEMEYVFCKDNRLVLIVECLFTKVNTANAGARALEAPPSGSNSSSALKRYTQIQSILAHTLKVAILSSYKKNYVGYFELKFHIHTQLYIKQGTMINPYTRYISEEKYIVGRHHLACWSDLAEGEKLFRESTVIDF